MISKRKRVTSSIVLFLLIFSFIQTANSESFNATMIVEANIIGFTGSDNDEELSIEVPDYIFLGNITKEDPVSEEITIRINNTGKTDITVTPQLKDPEDTILSYLFFRKQKTTSTNDSTLTQFYRIGDFSIDIEKPASGKKYRTKNIYMKLDLTDFKGDIEDDLIGYRGEIVFLAMSK